MAEIPRWCGKAEWVGNVEVARKASLAIEESVARAECICIVGRIRLVAVKTHWKSFSINRQGPPARLRESEIWSEPAYS
jgi:hypothetical protein